MEIKQGVNDASSNSCVNVKITRFPAKTAITSCWYTAVSYRFAIATVIGLAIPISRRQPHVHGETVPEFALACGGQQDNRQ
jgi:hypothetical protein